MNTDTKIFDDMFDVASALKDVNVEASKDLSTLVSQLKEIEDAIEAWRKYTQRFNKIK